MRIVLAVSIENKWLFYQMDVKFIFLNGILEEEVYVNHPLGYEIYGQQYKVYNLKKALYSLKQEPRAWYHYINSYLLNNGFSQSNNVPTLYIKGHQQGKVIIVCIYVDDIIYTGNMLLCEFKEAVKREFEIIDLGLMKYFLGIEVQ